MVRDYLFLRKTQVAKYFNRTPWWVSVTGGLHSPLVGPSVAPALPAAGLHPRLLLRIHPGRSPKLHVNAALFMTTCIAFMVYPSSLTGMRRLAFNFFRAAPTVRVAVVNGSMAATPSSGEGATAGGGR